MRNGDRSSFVAVPVRLALGGALGLFLFGCSSSSSNGSTSTGGPDGSTDSSVVSVGSDAAASGDGSSGTDGGTAVTPNTVIADQFNNRVIEVTPQGQIVWTFGNGSSVPGPASVVAPNDAERLPNGETLISGTGTAAGTEPACPEDGGGCPDNRVLLVTADGGIAWEYDDDGGLNTPVCSVMLPNGNVL